MKAENIKSAEDARNYLEGTLNDLTEGIITKSEALEYLGEYTLAIISLTSNRMQEAINK